MSKYDSPRRIYVACLASYNSGKLHGVWIDCEGKGADELQDEVSVMLRASPEPSAEEYAIHDHEGFGELISEYTSLSAVAELCALLDEHGEAFGAYAENVGVEHADAEGFQDAYCGTWDSEEAYAEHLIDEGVLGEIAGALASYIDTARLARDLFMCDYWRDDATGAVFRNC